MPNNLYAVGEEDMKGPELTRCVEIVGEEYTADGRLTVRCNAPAVVIGRIVLGSTDGPLELITTTCTNKVPHTISYEANYQTAHGLAIPEAGLSPTFEEK